MRTDSLTNNSEGQWGQNKNCFFLPWSMSHYITLVYKNHANHFDSRAIFVISKAYLGDGNIPIGYFKKHSYYEHNRDNRSVVKIIGTENIPQVVFSNVAI